MKSGFRALVPLAVRVVTGPLFASRLRGVAHETSLLLLFWCLLLLSSLLCINEFRGFYGPCHLPVLSQCGIVHHKVIILTVLHQRHTMLQRTIAGSSRRLILFGGGGFKNQCAQQGILCVLEAAA